MDIYINYVIDIQRKKHSLVISYNLFGMADIPSRLQNTSISAMDNIFIDYSRQGNYDISPIHNGLSDHDAQLISIHDVDIYVQT